MKKIFKKKDTLLHEFEKRDLGLDIARSQSSVVVRPRTRQLPTSILLDPKIIEQLKLKASHRGIGYQTMLKIIVHEHLSDY